MSDVLEAAIGIVNHYPDAGYKLEDTRLLVDPDGATGFPVALIDEGYQVMLGFGRWHFPFDNAKEALDIFEQCVNGEARIKEILRLGVPYKGILQILDNETGNPRYCFETGIVHIVTLLPFRQEARFYQNAFQQAG